METIILASGSPRRKELLVKAKMPVKVIPPELDRRLFRFSFRGGPGFPGRAQQGGRGG